jgi:tRNA-modifying protein YgfZ
MTSPSSTEYQAARTSAALVHRTDRVFLRMHGRDPLKMIQGLVTNDVAGAPADVAVYALLLSPKGRMLAEVRVLRLEPDILLETAAGALDGLVATLKKYVPPLFARVEDLSDAMTCLGVYGPGSAAAVVAALGAEAVPESGREEAVASVAWDGETVHVVRTRVTGDDGLDLFLPSSQRAAVHAALVAAGARDAGLDTLEVLRIEAGRPRWGAELDESVIPLEAGLKERAISTSKGCYTGQEVIIRILHRGHVNRHLRGFLLDDVPLPAAGTELYHPETGKVAGRLTSTCLSPRLGQAIALGYARREVVPPAALRLGGADGPPVQVVELPFQVSDFGEPATNDPGS